MSEGTARQLRPKELDADMRSLRASWRRRGWAVRFFQKDADVFFTIVKRGESHEWVLDVVLLSIAPAVGGVQ